MSDDERADDRWINEGGSHAFSSINAMDNGPASEDHSITSLPPFDHKESEDDDCRLPEHPIYANYVKYLWKGHTRSGGLQAPNASIENTDNSDGR